MKTWTVKKDFLGTNEYFHASGARVYGYTPKAFKGREWGVQWAHESAGCGGFESMADAKAYVEKFATEYANRTPV